jgi:hypothetical protein
MRQVQKYFHECDLKNIVPQIASPNSRLSSIPNPHLRFPQFVIFILT